MISKQRKREAQKQVKLKAAKSALFATFSSSESATNQTISLTSSESSASQKQQKSEISTSNRCQWCQLDYEIWDSHRLQYSSCVAQNQQAYEFVLQFLEEHACEIFETSIVFTLIASSSSSASQKQQKLNISSENLKTIKKIKINVVKNAKRVKSKALKTQEVAKSTSELQNIDIFDLTLTYENRRFNEIANFLQHLQQCQHQYKKSDLLFLLSSCLWDFVFDIWYDKQSIMNSASLCEWVEILRIDFVAVAFAKSKVNCSKINCMRCDQIFNFKKKLREHVREQHAKKSVNSSSLSIDTVKSVCEIEKKSTIIETFALQASHISSTTSRSQIVFEITSSKSSNLSIETFKVVCKTMKKSTVIDSSASSASQTTSQKFDIFIATSKQKFECVKIFETITSSKSSHLSFNASETVSKSMKNTSTQCSSTSSKSSSSKTFESEHHEFVIQKFESESSLLKISSDKLICETMKKSTVTDSSASFTLLSTFKRNCLICRIDVFSIKKHYLESSSCHEALRHRIEQQVARQTHQREQKDQKQTEIEKVINQSVSSVCSNLSIATFIITSERVKSVSIQQIACVRICTRCRQSFNFNNKLHEHIREHHVRKFVKNSNLRVIISESSYKSIEKSTTSCLLTVRV